MPISQAGSINPAGLTVPGVYVQIQPPAVTVLNGVPSNVVGIVGSASWGPVNSPTTIGGLPSYTASFGSIQARKYDLGTAVAVAALQGSANFRCVRVTDGTDTAAAATLNNGSVVSATLGGTLTGYTNGATVTFPAAPAGGVTAQGTVTGTGTLTGIVITVPGSGYTVAPVPVITAVNGGTGATATSTLSVAGATLTAKYTGSTGSTLQATLSSGSAAGTYKLILALPGQAPEIFDNIGAGLSANPLWVAIASAVNNGVSGYRGPSNLCVASAGAGTTAPAVGTLGQTQNFTGGTDGATSVTATTLLGADVVPRSGMYALRNSGCGVAMLADTDTPACWSTQVAYGLSEGTYMILTGPAGDNIANAIATKAAQGIDSYAAKLLFGDWVYFLDTVNNQTRLVSPQGYIAGLLGNLAPQGSSLNKALFGVVGTQKTNANQQYAQADFQQLVAAGIDVITNQSPGGQYFSAANGHNTSSNAVIHGDNYTRMTNYLAATLASGMGIYVGKLQTQSANDPTRRGARATVNNFLQTLKNPNNQVIADYQVTCDLTNNTPATITAGQLYLNARIQYLSVVEEFIVNLEGGQSVQIQRQSTTPLAA